MMMDTSTTHTRYEQEDIHWIHTSPEAEGDDYWDFVEYSEVPAMLCGKAIWEKYDGHEFGVILDAK